MCIRTKCILLETESTTVMIVSYLEEFDHEIDTEHVPPCVQNGEQLELANRSVSPRFHLKAKIIDTYILANAPRYLGPPVVPEH